MLGTRRNYTRGMLVIAHGERGAKTVFVVSGVGKKYTRGKLVIATGERGAKTVFVVSEVGKTYTREILVVARSPIAHGRERRTDAVSVISRMGKK